MTETRQQQITFGKMRAMGVSRVLVYCADYRCSHHVEMNANQSPDDLRLSDLETRFVCGRRGADVRPDFSTAKRRS
ncbi:hypothetical protein FJN17_23060 [Bradyrhizobium symbiodeficiens]|uniref:Uncharacterized protein n=1 Tax=Bradyrhizobium symbiodeficiens TaxID=1404367 RepID=A0ABX5WA98_9BRAD|nr:hypothetical protein [Bradyrhizobium symbiodeficiens]QDF40217.1 hypothetical protein FJN17_23060 [Bradyrhizobium symbiodeficiens]